NVQNGVTYCYRITARYASLSVANNPYNLIESKPSEEVCIKIDRDLPLLTRASVETTSPVEGVVELAWVKPEVNVDSLAPDGPYSMTLFHSTQLDGVYSPLPTSTVTAPTIVDFQDQYSFTHVGLNTEDNQHFYKVELVSASRSIGLSSIATTIFLNSNQRSEEHTSELQSRENIVC